MINLKTHIPNRIKFPFWFVFKSPQRKLGWYTLWLDLKGIFLLLFYSVFRFYRLEPISICVGLYNRNDSFLSAFLPSLCKCRFPELIELSVYDCGSEDIEKLRVEIQKTFKGKWVLNSETVPFSRAFSLNKAVSQSSNQKLFICDADFSIPENIVSLCKRYTIGRTAWFPIVFYLYKNKPTQFAKKNGEWMIWGGKGVLACNRKHFVEAGQFNENYKTWGYEDEDLWLRFYKAGISVIRTRCKALLHHWHPSLNPKYIKLEELADKGLL